MNIAFFGTSDKSIPILETLSREFNLVLCVTKEDTKVGRKQETRETIVKAWAKKNNVSFIELNSIKNQKGQLAESLIKHKVDLAIVADFSFMIPREIIQIPKLGIINIHFSLLPKLRGASPVQHAILLGLQETGITYYLLDEGMDTGNILHQIKYELNGKETSESLYGALFELASKFLPGLIWDYSKNKIKPKKQNEDEATYCYSKNNPKTTHILKEDAQINWQDPITKIDAQIRAFNPWPIAWTYLSELENNEKLHQMIDVKNDVNPRLKVKIYEAEMSENKLVIEKLQLEGKNITDWKSFVNGYKKK